MKKQRKSRKAKEIEVVGARDEEEVEGLVREKRKRPTRLVTVQATKKTRRVLVEDSVSEAEVGGREGAKVGTASGSPQGEYSYVPSCPYANTFFSERIFVGDTLLPRSMVAGGPSEKAKGKMRQVDVESLLDQHASTKEVTIGAITYELKMLRARMEVLAGQEKGLIRPILSPSSSRSHLNRRNICT
jgi:hypothetical protein